MKKIDPEEAIKENNLILVWCRGDYEFQIKGKTIQWLGTDFFEENEKITGKELEQLFLDLEKDSLAQACWINKEMSKVVIARIYESAEEEYDENNHNIVDSIIVELKQK